MKHTNLRQLCAIAALVIATTLSASPLSPEQALKRALGDAPRRVAVQADSFKLSETFKAADSDALYVFTKPNNAGFIVVSGNDAVEPLLGYGDSNFADENGEIAPAAQEWLEQLAQHIEFIASKEGLPRLEMLPRDQFAPIAPLCSTKWGQSWPYYNKCPKLDGRQCVTGCAATSMAQVMKYHNWPDQGEGKNSYTWNGQTLRMNFGSTTFRWDDMLDEYTGSATTVEQDAVATLMSAVGIGINMQYSPNGSGATTPPMGAAFLDFFKYSTSLRYLEREWLTLNELETIVYNSLVEYGPVVYNGQAVDGGHSFVCDGYDRDGFFHINWGWNGMSDGYFLLDVLDPYEQGEGGASSGFNAYQRFFADITPNTNENAKPFYQLVADNLLRFSSNSPDEIVLETIIYNPGPTTIPSGVIGLRFTPVNKEGFVIGEPIEMGYSFGGEEDEEGEESVENLPPFYGWSNIDFDITDLEEGRYILRPFFIDPDGEYHDITMSKRDPAEVLLGRSAKKNTFRSLSAVKFELLSTELGTNFGDELPIQAALTISNNVNATGSATIGAAVLSEDLMSTLLKLDTQNVVLDPDATVEVNLEFPVVGAADLVNGTDYPVVLYTPNGNSGLTVLTEPVMMRYQGKSGVRTVGAEDLSEPRTYYNLQGVKVAQAAAGETVSALPAGIYIVRSPGAVLKIMK